MIKVLAHNDTWENVLGNQEFFPPLTDIAIVIT